MDYYELMHKDKVVAVFLLDDQNVSMFAVNDENRAHLPLGVRDKVTFGRWLQERAVPATRYGLDKTGNTFQIMLSNLGLSLTDTYWVRDGESELEWSDVNFYTNTFDTSVYLEEFYNKDDVSSCTPSATLKGDLQKKWVVSADKRILLKGNSQDCALQSISEVLASSMYNSLGFDNYVKYNLIKLQTNEGEILGCCSDNFTSEDVEFVPAIDVIRSEKKGNEESYLQMFIRICESKGLSSVAKHLHTMLSVDFLLLNTDRHFNNFGILRDVNSLEWLGVAPVFDSGNSLFFDWGRDATLPRGKQLLQTKVNSFYNTVGKQLSNIDTGFVDITSLPASASVENLLRKDMVLTEKDIQERVNLIEYLQQMYKGIQQGEKPWAYKEDALDYLNRI